VSGRFVTLWSPGSRAAASAADERLLAYTVGDDRHWDSFLLPWDILGSLGHIAGLRAAKLLSAVEHRQLEKLLRQALRAAEAGELRVGLEHEDVHSAVELWLTAREPELGARLHTGRSRNDQVAVDLRLYMKQALLDVAAQGQQLAGELLRFAAHNAKVMWPGYTHQRRAMPSSLGLWATAFAEGLLDTLESLPALWRQVDRSPLGSAAGYGVPLPIEREVAAQALGFAELVHAVTTPQNGRGKLEAAVLGFCSQLGHEAGKLASDICLYSAEEFGYLVLPSEMATGSSIMPHKRNPDVFELTRARAAALDGELGMVLHLKSKLTSGYHRDAQLLKEPLMRGLGRTGELLGMMALAVPRLGIDAARCQAALAGGVLATDEVMRRVESGQPFRQAYHQVADELRQGAEPPLAPVGQLLARRRSTGSAGNLRLAPLRQRLAKTVGWTERERRRFSVAMAGLRDGSARAAGRKGRGA